MSLFKYSIILTINVIAFFMVTVSFAQYNVDKNSTITYKVKVVDDLENLDYSIKRKIDWINKTTALIECKLEFNSKSSIFYQVKGMTLNNEYSYRIASTFVRGTFYYNIIDSLSILNKNFSDRLFNVIIPWNKNKWKITNQRKIIDKYECVKAILVNSNLKVTAWFSEEIPVPFGPNGLDSLPGLILETNVNDKLFFYATNIELNNQEFSSIKAPYADKTITEIEFIKLAERKLIDVLKDY